MNVTEKMLRSDVRKPKTNASLAFSVPNKQTKPYIHYLWVEKFTQPISVNGTRVSSRLTAHWYPTSFNLGALNITIRERDQQGANYLTNYIRAHHRAIVSYPGHQYVRGDPLLLRLTIPSENLQVRGWIQNFTRTNKGVFEVAPQFMLDFTVVMDSMNEDFETSRAIREWWNPAHMKPTTTEDIFGGKKKKGKSTSGGSVIDVSGGAPLPDDFITDTSAGDALGEGDAGIG